MAERTLINAEGRLVVSDLCLPLSQLLEANQNNDWRLPELARKFIIPGLDANYCKCDRCEGIYWVDQAARLQIAGDKAARRKAALKL